MQYLSITHKCIPCALCAAVLTALVILVGCGGTKTGIGTSEGSTAEAAPLTVPKVVGCANGDHPESGLQGQVPAALRANGFDGFNCNLKLVGQYQGEGGGVTFATFKDHAGHVCAYYGTAPARSMMASREPVPRVSPGVQVLDITDSAHPVRTTSLTTEAMLDPWESLRINPRRQALAATASVSAEKPSIVDFYDLSADCRHPQLLSSDEVGTGKDGGIKLPQPPIGHEGNFAPDGLTYYVGDVNNGTYNAVDVTDMTHPKVIAQFDMKTAPFAKHSRGAVTGTVPGYTTVLLGTAHGLSVSDDGNRAYFVSVGYNTPADLTNPNYMPSDGFYIADTSEVQGRKPNAQMKLISAVSVRDGTMAQVTIPITVGGKPYLVFVDEGGSVYSTDMPASSAYVADLQTACKARVSPYPMARIFDLSDERHPKEVSKLMLEVHNPANCSQVLPDLVGLSYFTYGSHYCSADNRQNATALACAYINSGIRVFDIRDPAHPKEIAYYNPAGMPTKQLGSSHVMMGQWNPGGPDFCMSPFGFDFERRMLTTNCTDNGLLVLQFENGAWPMRESSPTVEQQN